MMNTSEHGNLVDRLNARKGFIRNLKTKYSHFKGYKKIHLTKDGREESWTPATAIAYFRQLVAMGIDQAIVSLPNVAEMEPFDLFATPIIPAVEEIEVADR